MELNDAPFTIADLLGGELTMVIPAIQRDFCWGLPPAEKVTSFIRGILHMYINDRDARLGLLYGYETPPGSRHIHIIDGQQRLTTLYLLLGMLYRRTPTAGLRRLLISDYQLIDEREPRLLYQVRQDAMYFMSDLVMNFFLNRDGRLSQLESSSWYYRSYDSDSTVQSFIGAIRRIDDALEEADVDPEWDFDDFAWYVCNRLSFIYCDLGTRKNAEQMYITVNTTGEPLTRPQRLKAAYFASGKADADFLARWDEMDRWFWNSVRSSANRIASDAPFDAFLTLWQSVSQDSPDHTPEIDRLYDFFLSYRTFFDAVGSAPPVDVSSPALQFRIIPAIAYVDRWPEASSADISRFSRFLEDILLYRKPSPAGADVAAALALVEAMTSADVLSLAGLPSSARYERVLTDEERSHLALVAAAGASRLRAEQALARALAHPLVGGRVMRMVQWCIRPGVDAASSPQLDVFEAYTDAIYRVWGTDIDCRTELDVLRCALLAVRHPEYPVVRRGETVLSLCWNYYDWQRLMLQAPGLIRNILDRVMGRQSDPQDTLRDIASKCTDRSNPWFFLLKNPSLMAVCRRRVLLRPCPPFVGLHDTESNSVRWFVEQRPVRFDISRWHSMRPNGSRCLYTFHRRVNLAVELSFTPDSGADSSRRQNAGGSFRIEVFGRADRADLEQVDAARLGASLPPVLKPSQRDGRYTAVFTDSASALAALHTVFKNFQIVFNP